MSPGAQALAWGPFPNGVADSAAGRAYVHDSKGAVVAIDLVQGRVLWRAGSGLRPLAVGGGRVIAARIAPPRNLILVALDPGDGSMRCESVPLPMPDWVRLTLHDTPDFTMRAEAAEGDQPDAVVLRWTARAIYRGGAPPGPLARPGPGTAAHGAARLAIDTCAIEALPAADTPDEEDEPAPERAVAAAPDVLQERAIGDRRFQLVTRAAGGDVDVVVRSVSSRSEEVAWEIVIDQVPTGGPRRPRP